MSLTDKQKIFADEYLIDLNGTRAYKVAYPNVKKDSSARARSSLLLTKINIRTYIDERLEEIQNSRILTAQEVLERLSATVKGEIKEQVLIGVGKGEQAITEIEVSEKDKLKALELLGKRYALFTDKQEISGNVGVVFNDDINAE